MIITKKQIAAAKEKFQSGHFPEDLGALLAYAEELEKRVLVIESLARGEIKSLPPVTPVAPVAPVTPAAPVAPPVAVAPPTPAPIAAEPAPVNTLDT